MRRPRQPRQPRQLRPCPTMPGVWIVPLSRGHEALVDAVDAEEVGRWRWVMQGNLATRNKYARRYFNRLHQTLHRFIADRMGIGESPVLDHVNGDGLDCRRCNIRAASQMQNARNAAKRPGSSVSRFKGVECRQRRTKGPLWRACIWVAGRRRSLGWFEAEEMAARVYDDAARAQFGEFALVNFPVDGGRSAIGLVSVREWPEARR